MPADRTIVRPWRLLPNRVRRFYRGGLLLERFQGMPDAADSDAPEDWVGSATRAWTPPGNAITEDGLGLAEVDGVPRRVADLVAADPAAVAGAGLVTAAGPDTIGVLVKLLDAGVRLPVHAHPTRAFARRHLGSYFGKAEAWLVLATRQLPGEPAPHVRLGFERDVARADLRRWIDAEDGEALLGAMHQRPVAAGDTWFVPAGMPHAIGAGVFLVEVQEPTDFSIVAESRGFPIEPAAAHVGLGWDVAIDAFDRAAFTGRDLDGLHGRMEEPPGGAWSPLLPPASRPFFRAARALVLDRLGPPVGDPVFLVGVVVSGAGLVRAGAGELALRAG
ncbi:MAG TPA: class I mannose-6-phosphate isomerase, partial [Candidatus Limnocylindrales bacterium]|nr:class I mannose-6-phosphate isomerase [Candidatus Limnocylindrales bacterium]